MSDLPRSFDTDIYDQKEPSMPTDNLLRICESAYEAFDDDRPAGKFPALRVDLLPIGYLTMPDYGGGWTVEAVDEDMEPIMYRGKRLPIATAGDDSEIADAIKRVRHHVEDAVDTIIDKWAMAYHGSDEQMRATHPREI